MKKIIILSVVFLLSINFCVAKTSKKQIDHYINFDGEKYQLLYSVKNPDFGGYLNEYYKRGETYNIWSEMVAIHHFPNAYSPIDQIKSFREYLGSINCPSALTFDDKRNTAIIDFILINDKRLPIILEFNVFKYEKSNKCGSMAVQYAKRYAVTTAFQLEDAKRDFEKNRKSIINKIKAYKLPEIVMEDIDKGVNGINVENKNINGEIKDKEDPILKENKEEISTNDNSNDESEVENNASLDSEENNISENEEVSEEADTAKIEQNKYKENELNVSEKETIENTKENEILTVNKEVIEETHGSNETVEEITEQKYEELKEEKDVANDVKKAPIGETKSENAKIEQQDKKDFGKNVKSKDDNKQTKVKLKKEKIKKVKQTKNSKKAAKIRAKEAAKKLELE